MIETSRLLLVPANIDLLRSAIKGNDSLAEELGFQVPDNWTEFGIGPLEYSMNMLKTGNEHTGWWTYFPIHKKDHLLIGSCGYKGPPSAEGAVEIGYEIIPSYRGQGFATEVAKGLIENAFLDERVRGVIAHTLAEPNASARILEKCEFAQIEEIADPDDGLIWKWKLK